MHGLFGSLIHYEDIIRAYRSLQSLCDKHLSNITGTYNNKDR